MGGILGRYSAVIITTVIFVILVVSVLAVNFNLSFQTEVNAEVVNVAGRQRMLSQRTAKSFANVRSRIRSGDEYQQQLNELKSASGLFNTVILAFKNGGEIKSTKSGQTYLAAVEGADGIKIVDDGLAIWQPLFKSIERFIEQQEAGKTNLVLLDDIQGYLDKNINKLLALMNSLTNYQEGLANDAADQSRLIQTLGIIASLLCFSVIMYLIFGQLRTSDQAAVNARKETERIFETVDQGLFLIDRDMQIGSQRSKALETIFSTTSLDGKNFRVFISKLISSQDLENLERYLKLLFDPHKKQRLLKDLNPLNRVAVQVEEQNELVNKYLNFSFSRVIDEGEIVGVLSSVSDITREVRLAEELELETRRNEQQMQMLTALMSADAQLVPEFIEHSDQAYDQINDLLKIPSKTKFDFQRKANAITPLIHKIKGESAAIGLDFITDLCHDFEDQVQILLDQPNISGEGFLSLAVLLEKLISLNGQMTSVFETILGQVNHDDEGSSIVMNTTTQTSLQSLVESVAERQNKKVNLSLAGFDGVGIPAKNKLDITSLASQLLRNAVAHGIESPQQREQIGKSEIGSISMALYDRGQEGFRLVCEDDGAGIDFEALTQKALDNGLLETDGQSEIAHSQIINLMLSRPLSVRDSSDEDAGRGEGMTVVGDLVRKLGGKISLSTKPTKGTRFTINLPEVLDQSDDGLMNEVAANA